MIRFSLVPSVLAFAATIAAQGPVLPVIPFAATQDLLVVDSSNDCVWRLSDFSQEGNYNGANEVLLFYSDIGNIALTNPTCIVVAPNGRAYVADSTEDKILELVDLDWDGAANSPGEFNVFFDSGKAELPANGAESIAKLAAAGKAGGKAVISGYHDATGDPAQNAELAKQRAITVRDALKAAGVSEDKIELKKPEQINAGDAAEARRVEVTVQ